ncbi:hypothetical protein [Streptomyces sp. NPDC087437]|uniref:hypothetical protein n=1 Tax=Streptomyces sp. NPDC087437 TaxID=3365789 RepID=UPI0038247F3E
MRVEFAHADGTVLDLDALRRRVGLVAGESDMTWQLTDSARRPSALIMVSKFAHCLSDLLFRNSIGELDLDVVAVVPHHPDLGRIRVTGGHGRNVEGRSPACPLDRVLITGLVHRAGLVSRVPRDSRKERPWNADPCWAPPQEPWCSEASPRCPPRPRPPPAVTVAVAGLSPRSTSSATTGFADNGQGGEVTVPGHFNQGLQVDVYRDRVVIKARDFATGNWMKQITVPLATRI